MRQNKEEPQIPALPALTNTEEPHEVAPGLREVADDQGIRGPEQIQQNKEVLEKRVNASPYCPLQYRGWVQAC